jgi:hypothetical protein
MMTTPPSLEHGRDGILAAQHDAPKVDCHGSFPHLQVHLGHVAVASDNVETEGGRIVVQNVQSAETLDGEVDHQLNGLLFGCVHPDGRRDAVVGPNALGHFLSARQVDVRQDDIRPGLGQAAGGGCSDARRSPRHHSDTPIESLHV